MTTDPIQRAFDGCAHEATTTQVRHTGTLQACDDCGQTWSFPATSATESDETSSSGSGYRGGGDRPAESLWLRHRVTVRKRDGRWSWRCTCTVWSVPPFTNTQSAALRWGCMHLSLICVASKFGHLLRKASTARQADFTLAGPAKVDR